MKVQVHGSDHYLFVAPMPTEKQFTFLRMLAEFMAKLESDVDVMLSIDSNSSEILVETTNLEQRSFCIMKVNPKYVDGQKYQSNDIHALAVNAISSLVAEARKHVKED